MYIRISCYRSVFYFLSSEKKKKTREWRKVSKLSTNEYALFYLFPMCYFLFIHLFNLVIYAFFRIEQCVPIFFFSQ